MSVGVSKMDVGRVDRLGLLTASISVAITSLSARSTTQSLVAMVGKGSGMMSHFESNFCLSPCRAGSAGPLIVALGHCMSTL
jgi:hypothetical protein